MPIPPTEPAETIESSPPVETSHGTFTLLGTTLHQEDANGQWVAVNLNSEVQTAIAESGPITRIETVNTKDGQPILVGFNSEGNQIIAFDRSIGDFVKTFYKNFRNMGDITILVPADQVDVNTALTDADIDQTIEIVEMPPIEQEPNMVLVEFQNLFVNRGILNKCQVIPNNTDIPSETFFLVALDVKYRDLSGTIQTRRVDFRNPEQVAISLEIGNNHQVLPEALFKELAEGATKADPNDGWLRYITIVTGYKIGSYPPGYMDKWNFLKKLTIGTRIGSEEIGSFDQTVSVFLDPNIPMGTFWDVMYGTRIKIAQ